ncbi:MAG TPA: ABC transporter permease [Devosiaceae bacterium]|jgi:peptide/nickel transport system permease protein
MIVFIARRIFQAIVTLMVIALVLFVGLQAIGNPADVLLSPDATQQETADAIARLGLDKPLWMQYVFFLLNAVRGNFGNSFVYGRPVVDLIAQRLPATLELAVVALAITVVFSIPLGIYAGLRPKALGAKIVVAISIVAFSLPAFWIGLQLVLLFAVQLHWLPSGGRAKGTIDVLGLDISLFTPDGWKYLLMPATTLALFQIAYIMRLMRASVREVALADHVRFARAKGLPRHRIILAHILKNALIPVVTVLGMEFGQMIALTVVVERVFAWPGLGSMLLEAIFRLDRPVVIGVLMTTISIVIFINMVVDIVATIIDPRVKLGEEAS